MQANPSTSLTPLAYVLAAVATILASTTFGSLITLLFTRKKQSADVDEAKARKVKLLAEADQIENETLLAAHKRISEMEDIIFNRNIELGWAKQEILRIGWELTQSQQSGKILEEERTRMRALLKLHSIPYA